LTATVTVRPRFDACDLEGDPDDTAAGAGAQLVEFCVREDQLEPLPDAPPGSGYSIVTLATASSSSGASIHAGREQRRSL